MFCKQCGKQIEDDSLFCRYCGTGQALTPSADAPPAAVPAAQAQEAGDTRWPLWVAGGVVAVLLFIALLGSRPKTETGQNLSGGSMASVDNMTMADALENLETPVAAAAPAPQAAENWSYTSDEDKVRGGTTYYARTTSTNTVRQDSPYDAETTMSILVRESPSNGTDVLLTISSGQMMCPSYEGCSGTVRFDDGPAQSVSFSGPADNSSETIFVNGAKGFIAKLKKAKRVIIEKTLYQAGNPQFEFDVGGLKWDH